MGPFLRTSAVGLIAAVFPVSLSTPAEAYPIDCAILLCLAGGFPDSAECSTARIEMIRRITPSPIEPPLQLWRCPMGGAGPMTAVAGNVPPEVRRYREGIEVWQLSKRTINGSGGRETHAHALRHSYDGAGNLQRIDVAPLAVPAWIEDQTRIHAGTTLASDFGSFDGILLRYHDHQGEPSYEWVSY